MIRFNPTQSGGRLLQGNTQWGHFRVEWNAAGNMISEHVELKTPASNRKPLPVPNEFDAAQEARRAKQGGCCGQPSDA